MAKKLFFVAVLLAFLIACSSAAFAKTTADLVLPTIEYCLQHNVPTDNNFETNLYSCLGYARPENAASCDKIPSQYSAELKEKCLLRGHYCESIQSQEIKQQCQQEKAAQNTIELRNSFWNGSCIIIPIIILGIIIFGIVEFFRKKLNKKKALLLIGAIVLLAIIWFFLAMAAPCEVCFTWCVY